MGSPRGIYVGYSASDLLEMIEDARGRVSGRQIISMSGGGKSVTYSQGLSAHDDLSELMFAWRRLNGGVVRKTHFDVSGQGGGFAPALSTAGNIPEDPSNWNDSDVWDDSQTWTD